MPTNESLEARVRARVDALSGEGLQRTLRSPHGIDFSSNDYLGLSNHPLLKERMIDAVTREGCGSTGSRLLRGHRESFSALEQTFAGLKQTQRALYFSSGYLANIAVLTSFPEKGDVILSDEQNHASLIDGIRLSGVRSVVFRHNDVDELARLVAEHRGDGQMFVVTESLFSMDGDVAPLVEYATICRSVGAALIVDEAHAVGVYGARGSGLIEAQGIGRDVLVSINTAGKALGVSGAFVAGPSWAIEYLIQRGRPFVFSTAPPPPLAAALAASLAIVASEPERREQLRRMSRDLRVQLSAEGVPVPPGSSQIVPVVLGDNDRALAVAQSLQSQGFDVRAIRPPSVAPGTARLRISVNVGLDDATIRCFAAALAAAVRECARCSAVCS
jgi:8-amino-7-oxononanoate synthase